MKIKYNLIKNEKNTKACLGKLETNYGTYETPMFMPVGTEATVKTLCVEELKRTSPDSGKVGKKKYAKGWTCTKAYESNFGIRFRVRNKNKPQITHLLEYGHAKVSGGKVEPRPHIKKAEENAKENLLKAIKGK